MWDTTEHSAPKNSSADTGGFRGHKPRSQSFAQLVLGLFIRNLGHTRYWQGLVSFSVLSNRSIPVCIGGNSGCDSLPIASFWQIVELPAVDHSINVLRESGDRSLAETLIYFARRHDYFRDAILRDVLKLVPGDGVLQAALDRLTVPESK